MRYKITIVLGLLVIVSSPAFAQHGNSEVSASFTGNFQSQATGLGSTDNASNSGGILVDYRYHFNSWSAIEVAYGITRFSQYYETIGGSSFNSVTQANVNQLTFGYVCTFGGFNFRGVKPYADASTGALIFSPIAAGSNPASFSQTRATFAIGGGLEYPLAKRIGIRGGVRVMFYQAPDFLVASQTTNASTHQLEPYVGVTFRF